MRGSGLVTAAAERAGGRLAQFHRAGILTAADVHVAVRLGALAHEKDDAVLLAVALVVRSTRHGSVVVDLDTVAGTVSADVEDPEGPEGADEGAAQPPPPDQPLDWPAGWALACAASVLVRPGPDGAAPIRMVGSRIWLSRYAAQEDRVAHELLARTARPPDDLDPAVLAAGLDRLFPAPADDDQRLAAAVCALSRVSVLAGGPGTGKTTTVARLLALLREADPRCRIALAAPTGKAAARLAEAVRASAAGLGPADRERLGDLPATTVHRMLGPRPDSRSRFRHDAGNRLPREVVVVDEASMVSLTLMARLLEALRPDTRLVLVGDPDQLASVEAGAVLADLVGTGGGRSAAFDARVRGVLPDVTGSPDELLHADGPPDPTDHVPRLADSVVTLRIGRRFASGGVIARLAAAVRDGRPGDALEVLRSGAPEVSFVEVGDGDRPDEEALSGLRTELQAWGGDLWRAATDGDAAGALEVLDRHRLLCAHRRGPYGEARWNLLAARWISDHLAGDVGGRGALTDAGAAADPGTGQATDGPLLRVGEPLLLTTGQPGFGLHNGDTGVVLPAAGGGTAAVGRGDDPVLVPLVMLTGLRPMYAMTVHRSQGSQFRRATVVLPPADSPLGTRQTVYTAITRATDHVRVIGSAEALEAAVRRPAARATGLAERLHPRPPRAGAS